MAADMETRFKELEAKVRELSDRSTGAEFGCAPARQFDGEARSIPAPARCGFEVASGDRQCSACRIRHERTLSPGDRNHH